MKVKFRQKAVLYIATTIVIAFMVFIAKTQFDIEVLQEKTSDQETQMQKAIKTAEIYEKAYDNAIQELIASKARQETEIKLLYEQLTEFEKRNKELIASGAKVPTINRSGGREKDLGIWHGTTYSPSEEENGNEGLDALGGKLVPGVTIAVDTDYWKLGTKFKIDGVGYVVARDVGPKVNGKNRFDLCVESEKVSRTYSFDARVWLVGED
jgi:3D (Asp-Asp-Asp) domain-containing protein